MTKSCQLRDLQQQLTSRVTATLLHHDALGFSSQQLQLLQLPEEELSSRPQSGAIDLAQSQLSLTDLVNCPA